MKKLILLSFLSFPILGGCSMDITSQPSISDLDINSFVNSGKDTLSGAWNTTKEIGTEYYQDQIKPLVDTAKDEIADKTNQLKDQYNQEVEKMNEKIQNQADEAKNQVNKLKVE